MENKANTVRKNFTYNKLTDPEIEEWFERLPNKGHSAYMRKAIKNYIRKEEENSLEEDIKEINKKLTKIEQMISALHDGGKVQIEEEDESSDNNNSTDGPEDEFLDAKNILKNLGK